MLSAQQIHSILQSRPAAEDYLLAFSGGLDSTVLLHLLWSVREEQGLEGLRAVHVHHGLQTQAGQWSEHCRERCRQWDIPFQLLQVNAHAGKGESPEAAARHARYQAMMEQMGPNSVLLTAHHANDQAETLMLQLLRGAGIPGLAAMPQRKPLGAGHQLRPLLAYSRSQLQAYAHTHGLNWIEDPSNADTRYERNFMRHAVLPLLQEHYPGVVRVLARSASHMAEADELLDDIAVQDMTLASPDGFTLSTDVLHSMSEARRHNLLRYWIRHLGFVPPDTNRLERIEREVIAAREDATPLLEWSGAQLRRYQGRLYIMSPLSDIPPSTTQLNFCISTSNTPAELPLGKILVRHQQGAGLALNKITDQSLSIRFRQGGERFLPQGSRHHRELKKLMQQWHIPPWLRNLWPLLYAGDELAAVIGLDVCEPYAAKAGEEGLVLEWTELNRPDVSGDLYTPATPKIDG